ncbi:MAG TPA: type II and III secretion system protein family protein [Stellaceae bacterium]|nr:type II and III secretion system protein family protein [Stellaceae bacterium]
MVTPAGGNAPQPATGDTSGKARQTGPSDSALAAMRQIPPGGAPILLEVGKGTLLRLPRPASTVFIANPDIADVQVKSPALIYMSGKTPGDTVVYAVDADDNVMLHSPVRVDHDLSRLRQSMSSLMPGEHITVSSVDGSVVLGGSVSTANRAEKARTLAAALTGNSKDQPIVNDMSVVTPNQVNLRVKIAEVNRSVLKQLGVDWSKIGTTTPGPAVSIQTANNPSPLVNDITIGKFPSLLGQQLSATITALTQEGLITTLAEPNLTALNGQTASFLVGGEFPIPIGVQPSGGIGPSQITIDFKTFGVSLDFTPTILDANHLNLKIRPQVSALSANGAVQINGFTIPALTVRRAETTVELGSGQSFALAGLLQNTTEQDVSKVPWLGDVPILGQLFRSDKFQHNESELVIIVTPYLVRPSNVALAAPTDGYVSPHDVQRVINGETYRQGLPNPPRGPVEPGSQGLIGPVGFRLD